MQSGGLGGRSSLARAIYAPGPLLCLIALSGCSGQQSVLNPTGVAADQIARLAWGMFAGAAVIFTIVLAILLYALISNPTRRRPIKGNVFILGGGIAMPVVTLTVLLFFVFRIGANLSATPDNPLVVEVTAHQWWWEIRYQAEQPHLSVTTANELHIPVGQPVELRLKTGDVIHTFWVPNLAGKRDMIPGMTNTLVIEAEEPGVFTGQCNEFCGAQHALMRIQVVAQPPDEFERWLENQRAPAPVPRDDQLRVGQEVFVTYGCALCHSIRGTRARGKVAPDLTHFGSRQTIGAGTLRNTQGNRQAWIVSSQHFKPDNHMPNYLLEGDKLRAVAAYLGSLE